MATTTTSPAHTPGPWTLEENDDMDFTIELRADSGSKHLAYIASMTEASEDDYDTAEECEANIEECSANARLIAAAPDLLEQAKMSLADAEEVLAHPDKAAGYNWRCIRDDLRMVIAKAEGRSRRKNMNRAQPSPVGK